MVLSAFSSLETGEEKAFTINPKSRKRLRILIILIDFFCILKRILQNVQMGEIGAELDIDFVISTGDNFYENGLTGVDDTAFEESFTNIFTAKSLQKQWYAGK